MPLIAGTGLEPIEKRKPVMGNVLLDKPDAIGWRSGHQSLRKESRSLMIERVGSD